MTQHMQEEMATHCRVGMVQPIKALYNEALGVAHLSSFLFTYHYNNSLVRRAKYYAQPASLRWLGATQGAFGGWPHEPENQFCGGDWPARRVERRAKCHALRILWGGIPADCCV
jgi:hypothetical protein